MQEDPESIENDEEAEEQPAAVSDSETSDDDYEAAQESPQKSIVVRRLKAIRNSLNTQNAFSSPSKTHATTHATTQAISSSEASRASLNSTLESYGKQKFHFQKFSK